jgi:hypothetical protein
VSMGVEIWCEPNINFAHFGFRGTEGNYHEYLKSQPRSNNVSEMDSVGGQGRDDGLQSRTGDGIRSGLGVEQNETECPCVSCLTKRFSRKDR